MWPGARRCTRCWGGVVLSSPWTSLPQPWTNHGLAASAPGRVATACTQTPGWRARQQLPAGAALFGEAPAALQERAAALVAQAHSAAMQREAAECTASLQALKELPRAPALRETLREALGARQGQPGRTLLEALSRRGLEAPLEALLELAPPARGGGGEALHLAAAGNHAAAAQLLLLRGRLPVNARDAAGRTPLHLAVLHGAARTARVLARFGADPEALDGGRRTALESAGPARTHLAVWLRKFAEKRRKVSADLGAVRPVAALGTELPAHVQAPKLVLTPVGYCPVDENGEVRQLARGIRFKKRRRGPSHPNNKVNWYCPRG